MFFIATVFFFLFVLFFFFVSSWWSSSSSTRLPFPYTLSSISPLMRHRPAAVAIVNEHRSPPCRTTATSVSAQTPQPLWYTHTHTLITLQLQIKLCVCTLVYIQWECACVYACVRTCSPIHEPCPDFSALVKPYKQTGLPTWQAASQEIWVTDMWPGVWAWVSVPGIAAAAGRVDVISKQLRDRRRMWRPDLKIEVKIHFYRTGRLPEYLSEPLYCRGTQWGMANWFYCCFTSKLNCLSRAGETCRSLTQVKC